MTGDQGKKLSKTSRENAFFSGTSKRERRFEPFKSIAGAIRALGIKNGIIYSLRRFQEFIPTQTISFSYKLRTPLSAIPLVCRRGTSDIRVFWEVFILRQYAYMDQVCEPELILDCGANVGFSSAYFLSRFPHTHVIAVEPDTGNYDSMVRNLAQFGNRVTPIWSAIWSEPCKLVISADSSVQGREWEREVMPVNKNSNTSREIPALDISTLLSNSGYERISILKMDVEGAEKQIFRERYQSWIEKCDNIIVELHDQESRDIFFAAIEGVAEVVAKDGDIAVTRRLP